VALVSLPHFSGDGDAWQKCLLGVCEVTANVWVLSCAETEAATACVSLTSVVVVRILLLETLHVLLV
jgi:hypothetical protein